MKIKSDKLAVKCYARHGDCCSLENQYGHHDSLGCVTGHKSDDYILVAQFAYLQEAIDYCQEGQRRGVNMQLVSRIVPNAPFITRYQPATVGGAQ